MFFLKQKRVEDRNSAIESGLRGMDLLSYLLIAIPLNNYIQVFRGNKLLLTSEPENATRDHMKGAC
jgi:hypothetical protein